MADDIPSLRSRDAAAIAAMDDVVSVHPYTAYWFSNASFLFPLLAALGALIAWAATASDEALGIAIFFAVVTLLMLPLVRLTWARTPTAIVLRQDSIQALHQGRDLTTLRWDAVVAVTKKDTMGNIRWYISADDEDHIAVEGEIAEIDQLLAEARVRAGLPAPEPAGR